MNLLNNKKLCVETIKRITRERNRTLGAIYRKIDTDQGRAHKSPLLKLRKKYAISLAQLSKATGIHLNVLSRIEADEPRILVKSSTLIKLADFFELKYWTKLITGDR